MKKMLREEGLLYQNSKQFFQSVLLSLKFVPTVPVVGVRKEGRKLIGPWGYRNTEPPSTGPVPVLGSERHR